MVQLGTAVHQALSAVGVTPQLVERWLGKCCCEERRRKLDQVSLWSTRVAKGGLDRAREYLGDIMEG